jgi:hypothetical protein
VEFTRELRHTSRDGEWSCQERVFAAPTRDLVDLSRDNQVDQLDAELWAGAVSIGVELNDEIAGSVRLLILWM